ncbi:PucR family transcriptional regulator [Actinomadura sp. 6N118]|uniref:PucR family transcriptional regulator n=1 Tax=Actinomadura sp. 6N118 TaxID=3375151 RepID=UPI0037B0DA12
MATSLRHILSALGDQVVEVLTAPRGLGAQVRDVAILDPEDRPAPIPGALALVIGARGKAALPAVRAAGRGGATAVAVKDAAGLVDASTDAGVALLAVRTEARWERLEALTRGVVDVARTLGDTETGEVLGDLFSFAQTIATLTGGPVSIEDTANRVLAYSRVDDEADEFRKLSILGWEGPERYMAMLREWGVFQRLHAGEGVVRVEERPELGIRRRIAAGVHAGTRPLGVVWVQEGSTPLTEQAETALLGASRALAPRLIRYHARSGRETSLREDLLVGLLDGRLDAGSAADDIGADPELPAMVVAFALRAEAGLRPLQRAELVNLISVHAAAYRRATLVSPSGSRVYALLPDLSEGAPARVADLAGEIVNASRHHLKLSVHAGLGGVVPRLSEVAVSRKDADRVLDAMARGHWTGDVASLADMRPHLLLSEIIAFLGEQTRLRDPRLDKLAAYDAEHGQILIPSLLAFLDALGDVRGAARRLNIHPNTLRYRVRRAVEISGIALDDPVERLLTELQLRQRPGGPQRS